MEALPELHQAFEVATAQTYGLVDLVFTCQTGFLSESIHKKNPMIITELSVPSIWLLGLGVAWPSS